MKVIHAAADLPGAPRRACIAIGVFDGVHLGHQQVIRQTISDASHLEAASVVVTFDRHPSSVVAPKAVPPAIYSLDQKLAAIAELGVDATLVVHFDEAFSRQPAEEFIASLGSGFGSLGSVCVGRDFTFGHQRQGNVALLEKLGMAGGFSVHALASVALDGLPVSSTRIRERIQAGDLDAVNQMLGRDYLIAGEVMRGDRLGRKLGFPTANVNVQGLVLPPSGVYAVHAFLEDEPLRGVANIGVRPTVGGRMSIRFEVHLLDFNEDIYGETLTVQIVRRLRDEMQFDSLGELQQQIQRDVTKARGCF